MMMRTRGTAALMTALMGAGLGSATAALAARGATADEARALNGANREGASGIPLLRRIAVSTKGPWAIGFEPGGGALSYQAGEVLFREHLQRWYAVGVITDEGLSCSVPAAVVADLALHRFAPECLPQGGSGSTTPWTSDGPGIERGHRPSTRPRGTERGHRP